MLDAAHEACVMRSPELAAIVLRMRRRACPAAGIAATDAGVSVGGGHSKSMREFSC